MMSLDVETLRIGRDRLSHVFRYLEALNQHRNPAKRQISEQPWCLWFRTLPDHPSIRQGVIDESPSPETGVELGTTPQQQKTGDDFVLKVGRPTLTRVPNPPDAIVEWLEHGWEDPAHEVRVRASGNEVDDQGETHVVRFEEDPQRPHAFERWKAHRDEWARNEQPAREAMKIFEQLYELYGRIEREAERVELILGDGILSWRRQEGGVYHPVLLQRVQLEFNPSVPEFTVIETEHEVELYSTLFRSMPDVDGKTIARCREELDQGDYHPLGGDATSGFLRRFVVQLSPRGEFIGRGAPRGETEEPRIGRDPVLFLRSRTLGFATAIEGVLADLQDQADLPKSLLNVVGIETPVKEAVAEDAPHSKPWSEPEEVLLSKPANAEQIRIAERLEQYGAVLVQGPPGTGKTHTIANLIGHLLAQGKSVLVTAHTTKALRVLREQVVKQLQPLCVSVLESDTRSQDELKSSIEAIVERLSTSDARQLEAEAAQLAARRRTLLVELRKASQDLTEARADEYRSIVVAGQSYQPSDAARKVTQEKGRHDWIPVPVTLDAPLPLSEAELIDLYRTNITVPSEDEAELSGTLPKPNELLTPEEFENLVKEWTRLAKFDLTFRADLWDRASSAGEAHEVESLADRSRRVVSTIPRNQSWELTVMVAGWNGGPYRELWDRLLAMIDEVCTEAANAQESLLRYAPVPPDGTPLEEQNRIIDEILQHLRARGNLGRLTLLTHPTWRRFIHEARVVTGEPSRGEHFQALRTLVGLQISRRELVGRWDRQLAALGGIPAATELGPQPERVCAQFSAAIRVYLAWHANEWSPIEREVTALGFRWEAFLAEQPATPSLYGDILRLREAVVGPLQPVLAARANAIRWHTIDAKFTALKRTLAFGSGERSAVVVSQLQEAVSRLEPEAYLKAFQRLIELQNRHIDLKRRQELLKRLGQGAPVWAAAIRSRREPHGGRDVPGDAASAWLWRQLYDELERRSRTSLKDLQQTIERLSAELRRVTAELIDRRAWAAQIRRTALRQRQALIGWLDTVRKIRKGTGKRAPRLRIEASRRMSECRSAVPVWIMPLARAVENFNPRTARFDVVIIDEASQSDVMALLALYLARQVVIVGDHEQVSPSAVGQDLQVVQHLIDAHLQGIPNAILYDGQMSVYDLARQSFGGAIPLLEHFRCVPEIIQFSNQLSYGGRIQPLRDPSRVQLKPHVTAYRVSGASSNDKINWEEIWTVASLVVAAAEQSEYAEKTFGVISLVGDEQALEINRLLWNYLAPDEYERRRVLCGNAAQFQGDERDVMFLSVVDTSLGGPLSLREQPMFKQRFNVAASRARDQMWVVHSLDPQNDLKPGDLRRRLIEYAVDPSAVIRAIEHAEKRVESEFEKEVLHRLIQAGYRVDPQWQVGSYRIDLVVMDSKGRRLAIECDGDRFHPIEKLPEDMARQAVLERLGWTFARIRGSQFFRDPDAAMQPVFESLARLEVTPEPPEPTLEKGTDTRSEELKERVIRRAHELLQKWREGDGQTDFEQLTYKPKADSPYRQNAQIVEHRGKRQPGERPDADRPRADTLTQQSETNDERTTAKEANPQGLPGFSKVEKAKTEKSTSTAKLQPTTDSSKEQHGKGEATQPQETVEAERQHLANRAREVLKTKGRISFTNQERLAIRKALGRASYDWSETKLAEAFLKELGK